MAARPLHISPASPPHLPHISPTSPPHPPHISGADSRFASDFVKKELLGKGGFGRVWRARNRLDGMDYAIKSVHIKRGQDVEKILREVSNLPTPPHTSPYLPTSPHKRGQDVEKILREVSTPPRRVPSRPIPPHPTPPRPVPRPR